MDEHPALVAAARFGLVPLPARPVVVADDEVPELLRVAAMDRLGGLLHAAIAADAVAISDPARHQVRELWHEQLVASVMVEALAVRTADLLDAAGVTWRLTKGPALAHLDYRDPNLRVFGDVDIIVHPSSWVATLDMLARAGCKRELAELGPGFDQRFGKGATITTPEGLEVDLHRRLAIGRFGVRLPTEALFAGVDHVTLAGRSVPTLDGPARLLHACYHAALGGFRHLRAHRDVAQLLLVSGVAWEATVEIASRHRVQAVVARAVDDAWGALRLGIDHPAHDWATRQRIARGDARALAVFAAERPFREQALTAVPVLVGRGATRYLLALARHQGRPSSRPIRHTIRRGVRSVVPRRPRV
jgi:Uncharacterised nucleotidyltransferase